MPRLNHTSSNRNIHRKSKLGQRKCDVSVLRFLSGQLNTRKPTGSYGAVRSHFHKSRRSSYLEMKLLTRLERSAARPAVTQPTHTHIHAHTCREELCGTGAIVSMDPVMYNWLTIFTLRHVKRMHVGKGEKRIKCDVIRVVSRHNTFLGIQTKCFVGFWSVTVNIGSLKRRVFRANPHAPM